MTIALVGVAARSGASGADPIVPNPSTGDGQLLVAMATGGSSGQTVTPPSDTNPWLTAESSINGALRLYAKFASSEPADYQFTVPGLIGSCITIVAFSGDFDIANPFAAIGGIFQTAQNGNIVIPSITPSGAGSKYAFAIVQKMANAAGQTFTPPGSPFVEDFDASTTAANFGNAGGHELIDAGVASGTRTFDPSSAANSVHAGYFFALNEVAPAAGNTAFLGIL